eukprot:EG_transcript_29514
MEIASKKLGAAGRPGGRDAQDVESDGCDTMDDHHRKGLTSHKTIFGRFRCFPGVGYFDGWTMFQAGDTEPTWNPSNEGGGNEPHKLHLLESTRQDAPLPHHSHLTVAPKH